MEYKNGVYSNKLDRKNPIFYQDVLDNIEIISKKPLKYNSISIFVGKKLYYFNNLKSKKIDFNSDISYSIDIPINNNKTFIQKLGVYFESIFYNPILYLIFYILMLIYFIKFKPEINLNIYIILLVALFLRLSHINFIPLWNDELYTLTHISNMGEMNFINTFKDPGNPPLFFILSNIWLHFFNKSIIEIRLLPCILGVILTYSIYFILKNYNKKIALTASFIGNKYIFNR